MPRESANRVDVWIYPLEFFIVFKDKKQLYRANATVIKTRSCLHKTLKSFSNDESEKRKNAIGLDWQNNNFARASRFFCTLISIIIIIIIIFFCTLISF